jgi:hypothetical protein
VRGCEGARKGQWERVLGLMKEVEEVLSIGWKMEVLSSDGWCSAVVMNILSYNVRGLGV